MTGNSAVTSTVSAASPATVPEATERPVEEESVTVSETTELLPTFRKGHMVPSPSSVLNCQHC